MSDDDTNGGRTGASRGRGGRSVRRRGFLRAAAVTGTTLAGVGLSGTAAAGDFGGDNGDYPIPDDYPVVTTRGQFDDDGDLRSGYTATEYGLSGDWSGYAARAASSEILVAVHGWDIDEQGARDVANTTRIALRDNGYDQLVAGFSWDSDQGDGWIDQGWNEAVDIARGNGPKLAQWIADWTDAGGAPIRLVGHSLGARVVVEALASLRARGRSNAVRSVSLLGGAIDDQEVETDEPYGRDIAYAARRFDNFHKTDDAVLDWAYGAIEFDTAVGEEGIQDAGDAPDNYDETDVTDAVTDHNSYYEPGEGCIPSVVETF